MPPRRSSSKKPVGSDTEDAATTSKRRGKSTGRGKSQTRNKAPPAEEESSASDNKLSSPSKISESSSVSASEAYTPAPHKRGLIRKSLKWILAFNAILVIYAMCTGGLFNASKRTLDRPALLARAQNSSIAMNSQSAFPLVGLHIIVTGATSGLGKATAAELYSLGASITLANRNVTACATVIEGIIQQYSDSKGELMCSAAIDFSDIQSVHAFAEEYKRTHQSLGLHVLINNAGMNYLTVPDKRTSVNGYDYSFSANYLGHFALTESLLPLLLETENRTGHSVRVVNVASSYHLQSDGLMLLPHNTVGMPLAAQDSNSTDMTQKQRDAFIKQAYSSSKLAQVLHAKEVQKRVRKQHPNTKLRIFSVCPAWASTGILPDNYGGNLVSSLAFKPSAASLAPLGAVFASDDLQGGEFISVFQNAVTMQSFSHWIFKTMNTLGIRIVASDLLSMFILARQGASYGVHVQPTSPEAEDDQLSQALFDWSLKSLAAPYYKAQATGAEVTSMWKDEQAKLNVINQAAAEAQAAIDETKAKAAADKVITDKAAADKVIADKAAADKAIADKAAADLAKVQAETPPTVDEAKLAKERRAAEKAAKNKRDFDLAMEAQRAAEKGASSLAQKADAPAQDQAQDQADAQAVAEADVIRQRMEKLARLEAARIRSEEADRLAAEKTAADKIAADEEIRKRVAADEAAMKLFAEQEATRKKTAPSTPVAKAQTPQEIAEKAAADKKEQDRAVLEVLEQHRAKKKAAAAAAAAAEAKA